MLITTGQPSVNPRVVKEADALHAAGCNVTVLYCSWIKWANDADTALLKNVKWSFKLVGGSQSKNKRLYFFTKARFKVYKELNKKFGNRFLLAERSQARCFNELLHAAKAIKADWYIGHNLGALSIAVKAADYNHASAGFDFEDYHREENAEMPKHEKVRIIFLEEKYILGLQYLTSSSPLIAEKVQQNFLSFHKPLITLLNCFSVALQPALRNRTTNENNLQLFWFSQTIGKHRGLETLIDVLEEMNDASVHLTLAGRCNHDMKAYIEEHAVNVQKNIHLAGIIPPDDLPAFAATFDIGLALETGFSVNNDIALSNKIFTYLLAGNAVILSETTMQKSFNETYKVGESFKVNDAAALRAKILLYKDHDRLNKQRLYNYQLAQNQLNWEQESKKLLKVLG